MDEKSHGVIYNIGSGGASGVTETRVHEGGRAKASLLRHEMEELIPYVRRVRVVEGGDGEYNTMAGWMSYFMVVCFPPCATGHTSPHTVYSNALFGSWFA